LLALKQEVFTLGNYISEAKVDDKSPDLALFVVLAYKCFVLVMFRLLRLCGWRWRHNSYVGDGYFVADTEQLIPHT